MFDVAGIFPAVAPALLGRPTHSGTRDVRDRVTWTWKHSPLGDTAQRPSLPSFSAEIKNMNAKQANKLRMYLAVQGALQNHQDVWQNLQAFVDGEGEFEEQIASIRSLVQVQENRKGGTVDKAQTLNALVDSAFEIAGAIRAYARVSADDELAATMSFSRSDIILGRDSQVLARCQNIQAKAAELGTALKDYGVTPAKVTALKNQTDAFAAVEAKPRQQSATSAAATKSLPQLFALADEVLNDRLDVLAVQFKETEPAFYNEYITARVIVDLRGPLPQPAPAPAQTLPKAA